MPKQLKPWAHTPKLTKEVVTRLTPVTESMKVLIAALADKTLSSDDLKCIILMEYERPWLRRYIVERCFSRIAKLHRLEAERILSQHPRC